MAEHILAEVSFTRIEYYKDHDLIGAEQHLQRYLN